MRTISSKVTAAGALALLLCTATAGAGIGVAVTLGGALDRAISSAGVLRSHMHADMMHDALRGDVLSALLSQTPDSGVSMEEVRSDLREHVEAFREDLANSEQTATDPEVRAALSEVKAPLEAYIASAEKVVNLSASDPVAARAEAVAFKTRFSQLEDAMEGASEKIEATARKDAASADSLAALARNLMVAMLAAAAGLVALLIVAARRVLVVPLVTVTQALERLATGDLGTAPPRFERNDEIGAMAKALHAFHAAVADRQSAAEAEAERQRFEEERARNEAIRAQEAADDAVAIGALARGLSALASGDLTYRIGETFAPKAEQLKVDFNGAMDQLQAAMSAVVGNVRALHTGTSEISQAADDLSRRTEQQAASLEETAAALDQITATVNRTASGARQAADVVLAARSDAETSGAVVRSAVAAMGEIEQSARQISQIIGVIDEIAFQTNLLALNAGVEAARAGDAGRGFAVVASEVRALAQRSADAAKEIKSLIHGSTAQVDSGVELVGQTGQALERIVGRVAAIDELVQEIAASAQEQATGLHQVNTAVNQMDQVTQQNAAMVEETTAASHSLAHEAQVLGDSVARFSVGAAAPAAEPRTRAARPLTQLRRSGGRGVSAALKAQPAEDGWEEF